MSKREKRIPVILVVGPTGSGKTQLSLDLAQQLQGEIISTDSMQVYRTLDIGTAKATPEEQKLVPHHQIDIIDPDESYSAGHYAKDTHALMQRLYEQQKPIVLVGGTGLYFRATFEGICDTPPISDDVKQQVQIWHEQQGLLYCYEQLQQKDPDKANDLHVNDTARILRALEVILETGQSIQHYQETMPVPQNYEIHSVGYSYERSVLYERINQRTLQMFDEGWIEETEKALAKYPDTLKPLKAIGYLQICAYLRGELSYEEMVTLTQQKTRNYAKRQITWFKKMPQIHWYAPHQQEQILQEAQLFLETI